MEWKNTGEEGVRAAAPPPHSREVARKQSNARVCAQAAHDMLRTSKLNAQHPLARHSRKFMHASLICRTPFGPGGVGNRSRKPAAGEPAGRSGLEPMGARGTPRPRAQAPPRATPHCDSTRPVPPAELVLHSRSDCAWSQARGPMSSSSSSSPPVSSTPPPHGRLTPLHTPSPTHGPTWAPEGRLIPLRWPDDDPRQCEPHAIAQLDL